ncbi:CHAT domain-containing protein [Micromonospora sp. HK10]|uniref:CHAT domain-containing protein n=1 Tax=Micromonospora sp. HK10 TaxID=1538294 RepID=UPI00069884BD|nr:CHAT domain-containing protein [Micromonospora sp. HK10]
MAGQSIDPGERAVAAGRLIERGREERDLPKIEEGVAELRALLNNHGWTDSARSALLAYLAEGLIQRSELTRSRKDAAEAAGLMRESLHGEMSDEGRAFGLLQLNLAHQRCYEFGGPVSELEAADLALRKLQALDAMPPAMVASAVGLLRGEWYAAVRDVSLLDPAIDLLAESLQEDPSNGAILAHLLQYRVEHSSRLEDADSLVELCRSLLSVDRRTASFFLGSACLLRYDISRQPEDLDGSVSALRTAIDLYPEPEDEQAMAMSLLVRSLVARFDHRGQQHDLTEALRVAKRACTIRVEDPATRAGVQTNLALAYTAAHERTGDVKHARQAERLHRAALNGIGGGGPERAALTMNMATEIADSVADTNDEENTSALWAGRRQRRAKRRDTRQIDEAIRLAREAVDMLPVGHQKRAVYQCNLSSILLRRHELTGRTEDVTEAVRLTREAADATRDRGAENARALTALGYALQREGRAPLSEIIALWRAASAETSARTEVRLMACRMWAQALMKSDDIPAALEPYTVAVDLFTELTWAGSAAEDSEHRMANWPHLANDAAACAVAADQPERALELLERGRAVLWSQTLNLNGDLADLHDQRPAAAIKLEQLFGELRADGGDVARRAALSDQITALVGEIRTDPRFTDFLGTPSASTIRDATADGPIVVINASMWRCDALVVTPAGVEVVPLPDAGPAELVRRARQHLVSVLEEARTMERDLTDLLDWLWHAIGRPVLGALGGSRPGRLWWCPTGLFAMLPLHAAQPRDGSPGMLDRVVSSYTPTVAALRHSRAPRPAKPASLVVVSVGDLPRQELKGAKAEAAAVVSGADRPAEWLDSSEATPAAVLAALTRASWSHFCCHGIVHLEKPSRSGLLLAGGELLSVARLRAAPTSGEFAFLSACHTALAGVANTDEAITLTAALQYAGWRQVVGTLWPLDDAVAVDLAKRFYEQLGQRADGAPDAETALHRSIRWLREARPDEPSLWANLIHFGA